MTATTTEALTAMPDDEEAAAAHIIAAMTDDDIAEYTREGWYDGVSAMLVDQWGRLDLDEVLDAMDAQISRRSEMIGE